jgi:hypothetical protein
LRRALAGPRVLRRGADAVASNVLQKRRPFTKNVAFTPCSFR